MAHNLVKFITDEDGEQMEPLWHFPINIDGSDRAICNGHVFGDGEGAAQFVIKIIQRGGITCPRCLEIIKSLKRVKP